MAALAGGGNAVDAAIAANAMQGVVAPETCGIGGDLFALVTGPELESPLALNSSGHAGSGAAELAHALRSSGTAAIPQRHPAAVTIPGCVDGWLELHRRLGRIELETILEPAARVAAGGFPASREMAVAFAGRFDELRTEPSAAPLYSAGRPPLEGERIVRQQLATTLKRIADEGREAFYGGTIGRGISEAVGGAISVADLEAVQAEWVDPLSVDIFGARGWTIPPNSQGYISLLGLAIVDRLGLTESDDPLGWHHAIEAYRLAAEDRDRILADPDSMEMAPEDLLAPRRIDGLVDRYSPDCLTSVGTHSPGSGGTAFMCVVDGDGLGVSLIQSNFYGIGSGISVQAGGFLLHDRGRGFTLTSGHPNELAPGRRPLHTLSPTIWTRDGNLSAVLGTRGGFMQPQLIIQLASLIIGRNVDPGRAMSTPRWMLPVEDEGLNCSSVEVEPGTPATVVDGLHRRGHRPIVRDVPQPGWGPMSVIRVDGDGRRVAAADPRVDTAAATAL